MSMSERKDSGHRPWADHKNEKPNFKINDGPEGLHVSLDAWGPSENLYSSIYNQIQSNWGDAPSQIKTDSDLTPEQMAYVEGCISGKTIPNVLEAVSTMWTVAGVSRAFTHQFVRTRLGASFMQHGGRDNDWRHRNWRMPETIRRACLAEKGQLPQDLLDCIIDWGVLDTYLSQQPEDGLRSVIENYIQKGKELYSALVDAGIPWQDARRVLHMGTETYIHANYNFLALKGLCANRLEHVNDWEINCVTQLMVREVRMKMPQLFGKYLLSHSDIQKRAAFAGLDSWAPDQKYPAPWKQSERKFRPEQNPFFVLTDEAMNGGEIEWVKTNGTYPGKERNEIK